MKSEPLTAEYPKKRWHIEEVFQYVSAFGMESCRNDEYVNIRFGQMTHGR